VPDLECDSNLQRIAIEGNPRPSFTMIFIQLFQWPEPGMQIFATIASDWHGTEPEWSSEVADRSGQTLAAWLATGSKKRPSRLKTTSCCQSLNQNVTWRGSFAWRLLEN